MTMTTPPRPGYWLANDGKWYPPELHPDRIRERLAAEREQSNAALGGHAATPPKSVDSSVDSSAATPESTDLASPMPHPSEPPLDDTAAPLDPEVADAAEVAADTSPEVLVPETPEVLLDETPEVLVPETPDVLEPEIAEVEIAEVEVTEPEMADLEIEELADLEITEPDGPTDAELLEIERLETEAASLDIDLPVDEEISTPNDSSVDSRWSRRPETADQSDTVPLVPAPPETIEAPALAQPMITEPTITEPTITEPTITEPMVESAVQPPAAPPVFEAPTPAPTAPTAPVAPTAPTADAASAQAPPIEKPAAASPQRSPIPEPFPEASADDLVEEQPQKSFLRRWWLPVALVLASLALVNWVIMPYIDTDRNSGDEDQLNVFELETGTCINEPDLEVRDELKGTVERVACSSPHSHEIFHRVNHDEGPFDRTLIEEFATNDCLGMFETYTGEFYSRSQLKFILLLPNEKAWDKDDRTTICALFGDDLLTESARS